MVFMSIFVSHSHHDNAFCQPLVQALHDVGADVWYDEHTMRAGHLGSIIERELRARPVCIIVLSPSALMSTWVEDEARWFYQLYRRDPTRILLPVVAQPLVDISALWLFLNDFKRIEAGVGQPYKQDEAIRRVVQALALTPVEERVIPLAPQTTESAADLLERGKALRMQSKYREALVLFQRAATLSPLSSNTWFQLGYTFNEMKQYQEALSAYDHGLILNPDSSSTWNNKGVSLRGLKQHEEALIAYEHALTLDPNSVGAWNGKGNALYDLRRYEEALTAYDHALVLDPNDALVWCNRSSALRGLRRYKEALDAYEHALMLDPTDAFAWNGKGETLQVLGRNAEAQVARSRAKALGYS